MVCVFVGQALNAILVRFRVKLEKRRRKITDAKLQRITSLVEAIRHLRWYGWQDAWLLRILEARQRELTMRIYTGLLSNAISFTNNFSSGKLEPAVVALS